MYPPDCYMFAAESRLMNWMECGAPQTARRIVRSLPRNEQCSSSSSRSDTAPVTAHAPLPCVFVTDGSGFAHFVCCIHCATDILLFPIPATPSTMPWYSHARLGCVFVTDGTASAEYTQLPVPGPGRVKCSNNSRVWIHMVLNTQCIFASKWQVLHNYGWLNCLFVAGGSGWFSTALGLACRRM